MMELVYFYVAMLAVDFFIRTIFAILIFLTLAVMLKIQNRRK